MNLKRCSTRCWTKGITPYLLDKTGYEVQLMGMYDMYMNSGTRFYQQDGTVKFAPLEDKFLDYLTLLNKWYQKGYISKTSLEPAGNRSGYHVRYRSDRYLPDCDCCKL